LTGPDATAATPGVVTGRPLTWLRIDGLAVARAGLALFAGTGQSWWLIPALFLLPDLSWLGYLAGPKVGAWFYNLAHTEPLPLALLAAGAGWHISALTVAGALGLLPPRSRPPHEVRPQVRPQLRLHAPGRARRPLISRRRPQPGPPRGDSARRHR
jgi:Domain of unknown function (DUF4260)